MRAHIDELAIFGGAPLFATPRPIGQLATPPIDDYLALMRLALAARGRDGGGIIAALEHRLADLHDVKYCVAVANAGLGIIMLFEIFSGGRRGEVVMPAFTFRGLPHFAQWAGQAPRFADVDPLTHGLDPRAAEAAITERTTAILAVCNFNSPGDIDGLTGLAGRRGIPIFFDSVYAVGTSYRGRRLGGFGRAEVFSLHATKLINGFEGGYITTNDDALAATLYRQRATTLPPGVCSIDAIPDRIKSLSAELNEFHAAMAYLSLDGLDAAIARNKVRADAYGAMCRRLPGLALMPYPDAVGESSNYAMAIAEITDEWPLTRDQMLALLRAEGAAINPYYSPPLHRSAHRPAGAPAPSLPVSEALARRLLQLPVGDLVSVNDIGKLGDLLDLVRTQGVAIAARMSGEGIR